MAGRPADRHARTPTPGHPGRGPTHGRPARRGGRRHRRLPHARRAPRGTGHPHRGRHRGDPHPPPPTGPVAPRHRAGDLRRDPRAQPPGRPRARPHPRRPRRAASRPAHPGHVGHPRHRPGRQRARRRRTGAGDRAARAAPTPSRSDGVLPEHPGVDRRAWPRRRRRRSSTRCVHDEGDVLVFLAGAADIRRVESLLGGRGRPATSMSVRCSARSPSPSRTWRWPPRRRVAAGSCSPPTSPRPASRSRASAS